ncbi:MAG TPA: hypothetical protein VH437_16070 [Terriglobales bacterium]|jgi:hypothetical protein
MALEIKRPQVLADDLWHAHAQCRREVLNAHLQLTFRVLEKFHDAFGHALYITGPEELDSQSLFRGELLKVRDVRGNHRHAIRAC